MDPTAKFSTRMKATLQDGNPVDENMLLGEEQEVYTIRDANIN